jgi:hypothetical protein
MHRIELEIEIIEIRLIEGRRQESENFIINAGD